MPRGKNVERIATPETDLPDLSGAVADHATFWPEGFDPDIAEGPRPFAWLSEGAKAVRAEMREASEELRALRRRAPGGRAPANYEQIDARMPRDADDFETVCAEWMRMAGFSGVQRTLKGPDGGVDVIASTAVGQAKFHPSQKVSAEAIRALVGSKIERGKDRALFFHYGPGYTAAAIDAAVKASISTPVVPASLQVA